MPRVTIALPTVARIAYLREALESVEAQTFRDFEIVIGDNSASSEYAALVDGLAATFSSMDVRIYHHPADLGMIGNARFLVEAARGELWILLPDDDRLTPDCLATLVAALDAEPRAGLAFSDHFVMDAAGKVDLAASDENSERFGRTLLRAGFHPNSALFDLALRQVFELQSMLFRLPVLRALGFRESAGPIPDFDLQLRLWKAPMEGVVYCAARLNEYRHHAGQWTVSTDHRGVHRAAIAVLETAAPEDALSRPRYRARLAHHYAALANLEAQSGESARARACARRAIALDPRAPRAYAALCLSHAPPAFVRMARQALHRARKAVASWWGGTRA